MRVPNVLSIYAPGRPHLVTRRSCPIIAPSCIAHCSLNAADVPAGLFTVIVAGRAVDSAALTWILVLIDEYTRQCLATRVARRLSSLGNLARSNYNNDIHN